MSAPRVTSVASIGDNSARRLYYLTFEQGDEAPVPLTRVTFHRQTYLIVGIVSHNKDGQAVAIGLRQE